MPPSSRPQGPLVALIGRPNVGKSTLFNRLVGRRDSLVDDMPGLTRDRRYGEVEWRGRHFRVVDTAGWAPGLHGPVHDAQARQLDEAVMAQTSEALGEADLVVFVGDARSGTTALEEELAGVLRRSRVPTILVANKAEVDAPVRATADGLADLARLGLDEPLRISALHGQGVDDLLEMVRELLPGVDESPEEEVEARVAIVGRPNVGKSSLLNALVGSNRAVVSPVPGTTRDTVDSDVLWESRRYRLVDTAGLRRAGMVEGSAETLALMRARKALEAADVGLIVLDGADGVRAQDQHVAGYARDAGTSAVMVVNKWDIAGQQPGARLAWRRELEEQFPFLGYAERVFLSALRGFNADQLFKAVDRAMAGRNQRLTTQELRDALNEAMDRRPPPTRKGRQLRLHHAVQAAGTPPTVVLFVNDPELAHFSYERYLEKALRRRFGFPGTPLRLVWRRSPESPRPRRPRKAAG